MNRSLRAIAGVLVAGLLPACSSSAQSPTGQTPPLAAGQVLTTDATIRFINLEGGCWAIETAPGERYEPVNLAAGFRTDGLQVHVVLRDAPDMAGICMIGPFVSIDRISVP
jgi:hypothetical protein